MAEFENGRMRLGNPQTRRAGGVTHLIHPNPTNGVRPWCRPGYKNDTNYAQGVPDSSPVTCRLCLSKQTEAATTPQHRDPA